MSQHMVSYCSILCAFFAADVFSADVHFNAELLHPSCLISHQQEHRLTIDCPAGHPGYQFSTLLADMAVLPGSKHESPVRLFLSETPLVCDAKKPNSAVDPHRLSSQKRIAKSPAGGVDTWYYCLQSVMPLNGAIAVDLTSLNETPSLNVRRLDVHFMHDSTEISAQVQTQILTFLAQSGELAKYRVELQAHASEIGNDRHNEQLSKKRLVATRAFLLMKSPWTQSEITGASFGESRPFLIHPDASSHQWNRRVSILLIPKK